VLFPKKLVVVGVLLALLVAVSLVVGAGVAIADDGNSLPAVYLIVDGYLYEDLEPYLELWIEDLQGEGYDVLVYVAENSSASEIRELLHSTPNLVGAVIVGWISAPWFEDEEVWGSDVYHACYPCDLYFMDLDGEWTDIDGNGLLDHHVGDVAPEIWVGRLTPPIDSPERAVELLKAYFIRNHLYRTGGYTLPDRALIYLDDDFRWTADYLTQVMEEINQSYILVDDAAETNAQDFLDRLAEGWSIVHVEAHGAPQVQLFKAGDSSWSGGCINPESLRRSTPKAALFLLGSCSSGLYTKPNYIAGWYAFTDYGLAVVASAKDWAGFFASESFYTSLDRCLGEALKSWLEYLCEHWNRMLYHGVVFIGDPTLRLTDGGVDADGDCLSDQLEERLGLNPRLPDTDGDGVSDYVQVLHGGLETLKNGEAQRSEKIQLSWGGLVYVSIERLLEFIALIAVQPLFSSLIFGRLSRRGKP